VPDLDRYCDLVRLAGRRIIPKQTVSLGIPCQQRKISAPALP
jgi:hypothetical protein